VKLQHQAGATYETKAGKKRGYDKWVVVIPPEVVETLGWKKGLELVPTTRGDALTLRPASTAD